LKNMLFYIVIACLLLINSPSYADEDLYSTTISGYNSERQGKADAQAINVYDSWSDNMAHLIESKRRPGKVIDPNSTTGTGNLTIERGTKINGPIIYNPTIENTITIVKPMNR